MKKKLSFFAMLVLSSVTLTTQAWATRFDTGWKEFRQPNGVTFIGRMWGDEYDYTFLTKEGYPFDKNFSDGYYYFADSEREGIYQLSKLRVGIDVPVNIPKNLSAHIPKRARLGKQSLTPPSLSKATAVTWTLKVIMVEFQDVHGNANVNWTRADFSNMLFSSNYYNSPSVHSPNGEDVYGSLRDYYDAMSNGNLIVSGQILNGPLPGGDKPNWIRLSQNKSYYRANGAWVLRDEAVNLAAARGYDTSTNATTKLVILYAGNFYLSGLTPQNLGDSYIIFERWGGRGQYDDTYQNGPPYFYDLNAPFGHIGVHAHEFGHFFWLVDLYNSPYNIIEWDLMGDATDLGGTLSGTEIFSGSCPGSINPEFRRQQGWITVQDLTSDVLPATFTYNERTPTVYRRQVNTNEYFLAESKRFQGFSRFLPGHNLGHDGGLLIWQVQGTLDVYLERADNVADGDYYNGEPNDIFPGPTVNNTNFHPLSTPNSSKLDGTRSGFGLTNISILTGTGASANAYINYLVSNSTNATAANNSRKLARDATGKYHLVYESGDEVYYQYSTTGVNTWLGLTRLSNGVADGAKTHPSIFVRDGNIFVVWQKNTGSSHDITFHKSTDYGATWSTSNRKVIASQIGSNPPFPVIVSPATNQLMVVYRTATNLSYQTSSNDGSTWSAVTAVPSSGTSGNSPALAITTTYWGGGIRTALVNAATGGNGAIFYRYYINGPDSTVGWASLLKNLSIIVPGTYTNHKNPSLAPSGTTNDHRLHVAWEANTVSNNVIIHRKATDWGTWPNVYSLTYYEQQQQPSITGLQNDTAELLFKYATQNIIYKMHYDGTYWGGPVSVGNGFNPSVSVGNTTAKYVWTSGSTAPYQIQTSTETLSKTSGKQLALTYHRSIAVIDTTTRNWLEVRLDKLVVKTKTSEEFAIPFVEAKEDTNSLTPANAFINLASSLTTLPTDAESLLVHCQVNGQGLSAIKSRANLINVEIALAKKNGVTLKLPVITTSSESLPETKRTIALLASNLAGGEISLRAQVSGIDDKSSLIASLGHIYEIVETPAAKVLGPVAENTAPQDYALSAYPNPFNPSTQIRFAMKEAGIATLRIYNLNGQLVRELLNEHRAAGEYALPWDGHDNRGVAAASGVYFIRFEAGNEVKQNKVMLVR